MSRIGIHCAVILAASTLVSTASFGAAANEKIVIAHRGASGYLPEHTLEAYAYAHAQGAGYIEPDVVLTRDGAFICLHDIHLESTTNVEEMFPERHRDDGRWYAADFDLAEIKRLNAHERLAKRFPQGRSRFEVPTLAEMIELVQGLNATTGREAGIYPELKAPAWHRAAGLPMEEAFLALVASYGYSGKDARIYVQCFDPESLIRMREELDSDLPQVQLTGSDAAAQAMLSEEGLRRIATYANGIGPAKTLIEQHPDLVKRAHAAGLKVHPYTFRADQVPQSYASFDAELHRFYFEYDVDGLFTDFPDRAVAVIRASSVKP